MAELQAIWTRNALPDLKNKIHSYRAGISKSKRRQIEKEFKEKKILGISSTNALELGIDIAVMGTGFFNEIIFFLDTATDKFTCC